jgi:hypothetical protein
MGRPQGKTVLVHHCKHPDMDDGQKFNCSCRLWKTFRRAKEMVKAGLAVWKKAPVGRIDHGHILVCRPPIIPRAATIEQGHIERAYVDGNKYERDRIEAYAGRGGNAS